MPKVGWDHVPRPCVCYLKILHASLRCDPAVLVLGGAATVANLQGGGCPSAFVCAVCLSVRPGLALDSRSIITRSAAEDQWVKGKKPVVLVVVHLCSVGNWGGSRP